MITQIGDLSSCYDDIFLKMWRSKNDAAMRFFQDHRHENFEISMVVRGEGTYDTVNGVLDMAPGDVFVFPSNEPHYILEIKDCGLEIINLHFNNLFFQTACSISEPYPNLYFTHSASFPSRIPAANAEKLRALLNVIQNELSQRGGEYTVVIHSMVNLIFAELVRSHSYYCTQDGTHTAIGKIAGGLRYIDSHFTENITLKDIASESGLSANYFTSVFKNCFHIRLWDYVVLKRIHKAKKLLSQDNDLNILDIALSCGFNNTANFNRAFLKLTGCTPKEYQRNQKNLLY